MPDIILSVGTAKGLFLFRSSDRDSWKQLGPFLPGIEVTHATWDGRTGTLYATANNPWFGPHVSFSADMGETWQESTASPRYAEDAGRAVEKLWRIEPGRATEPDVLYCGVGVAGLFRSEDGGLTWQELPALSSHPTKSDWQPGAGGLITHSVVLDPADRQRMWVAISAAGVFRTADGGVSWQPANSSLKNILTKYDENAELYPLVGQCVHHITGSAAPNRLYAQTHMGTYRSDDGAETWTEITEGLPSDFGMSMAAHPRNPDIAYVLPLQAGEFRCPPEGKLRVFKTVDAGKTWQAMTDGLPQENAFMGCYRESMCTDALEPAGVYFGTNTGQLYASADEGQTWQRVTSDLPPISSVNAAVV